MHRFFLENDPLADKPRLEYFKPADGGYDKFRFASDGKSQQQINSFIRNLNDQFSCYYTICNYRSELINTNSEIFGQIALIVNPPQVGFLHWPKKFLRDRNIINSAYGALLQERMVTFDVNQYITKSKNEGDLDESSLLYKHFQRLIEDMPSSPIDEMKDILKINEERHQRIVGNSFALSSAIAGALIGALITFLLSSHTQPKTDAIPQILQFQIPSPSGD